MSVRSEHTFNRVLQLVQNQFPGVFFVPLRDAAPFCGFAYQTARNMGPSFPIKTTKQGKLRLVPVVEIAHFIAGKMEEAGVADMPGEPTPEPATLGRRRRTARQQVSGVPA